MINLVILLLFIVIIAFFIFRAVVDGNDGIPQAYDVCDDCDAGWCDAFPNDEECRKWRKRNEQHNDSNDLPRNI